VGLREREKYTPRYFFNICIPKYPFIRFIKITDFIGIPSINKMQLLIGDHGYYFNENIGNILDIKVKKYLKNLVYTRDQYILNS
jgi:hypothetical protein